MSNKKEKRSYSEAETKQHIFDTLNNLAETTLQQRRYQITKDRAAAIVSEYKDIIYFISNKIYDDVINPSSEICDIGGFYTDKCVYEAYLLRFIPEFNDFDFRYGNSIPQLEAEIEILKEERRYVKRRIYKYNCNRRRGPPYLNLNEIKEVDDQYNELFGYSKVPIDIFIDKRRDIIIKLKELLALQEKYMALFQEYNKIKKDIRRCFNRITILKK